MTDKEKFRLLEVKPKKDGVYIVSLFELSGKFEGKHKVQLTFKNKKWGYEMRKNEYVGFIEKVVG